MLRLLIKDITVEKPANQKQLLVHIRWEGGACSNVAVQLPLNIADRIRYPSAVVDKVRELAHHLPDSEIAESDKWPNGLVPAIRSSIIGSITA